jgi:hypothetical protein
VSEIRSGYVTEMVTNVKIYHCYEDRKSSPKTLNLWCMTVYGFTGFLWLTLATQMTERLGLKGKQLLPRLFSRHVLH